MIRSSFGQQKKRRVPLPRTWRSPSLRFLRYAQDRHGQGGGWYVPHSDAAALAMR